MRRGGGFSLGRVTAVLIKEFKQLTRDRITYAMMLAIPVVQLLLFGYAINTEPRHLPTAVLVQEDSRYARSITAALKNSNYFDFVGRNGGDRFPDIPFDKRGHDAAGFLFEMCPGGIADIRMPALCLELGLQIAKSGIGRGVEHHEYRNSPRVGAILRELKLFTKSALPACCDGYTKLEFIRKRLAVRPDLPAIDLPSFAAIFCALYHFGPGAFWLTANRRRKDWFKKISGFLC